MSSASISSSDQFCSSLSEGNDRGRLTSLHRFSFELTFRIMLELIVSDHANASNQRHEPGRCLLFNSTSNLTLKVGGFKRLMPFK
jgi:hypothetical protein